MFISKFEFEMRSSSNIETTRHNMTGAVRSNLKIGNGARLLLWHLKAYIKLDTHNSLNTFYSKKAPYIFKLLSTLCLKPFYKSLNNADFLLGIIQLGYLTFHSLIMCLLFASFFNIKIVSNT